MPRNTWWDTTRWTIMGRDLGEWVSVFREPTGVGSSHIIATIHAWRQRSDRGTQEIGFHIWRLYKCIPDSNISRAVQTAVRLVATGRIEQHVNNHSGRYMVLAFCCACHKTVVKCMYAPLSGCTISGGYNIMFFALTNIHMVCRVRPCGTNLPWWYFKIHWCILVVGVYSITVAWCMHELRC